jgi:hypothetical protein
MWYVKNWFNQTVPRNRRWWSTVGYPGYVEFWKDVDEARKEGKYKTKPLFVDVASEEGEEAEGPEELAVAEEIDHISVDSEAGVDDHTNDVAPDSDATDAENCIGVMSSPETD